MPILSVYIYGLITEGMCTKVPFVHNVRTGMAGDICPWCGCVIKKVTSASYDLRVGIIDVRTATIYMCGSFIIESLDRTAICGDSRSEYCKLNSYDDTI